MVDSPQEKSGISFGGGDTNGRLTMLVRGSKREMRAYTVTETEFIALPMWKTILKFSDHVMFSAGSFAAGLIVQACFLETITPTAKAILIVGIVFSAIIGIAAFGLRRHLNKGSNDIEAIIKTETIHEKDESQGSNN